MIQFAFIFAFVISLAATALGILLTIQIKKQNFNHPISNQILFQQILFFVFAFYVSWGQVLTQIIFSADIISVEIIDRIASIIALFSIPFLLGSWYFLLIIGLQLARRKKEQIKAGLILLIAISIGITLLIFQEKNNNLEIIFQKGFSLINAIVYSFTAFYFGLCKHCKFGKRGRLIIILLIIFLGAIVSVCAWFHSYSLISSISFIIVLFLINIWVPIFIKIGFEFANSNETEENFTFDNFCLKYEISKREKEIIPLISEGLTNKDIAKKLFITLQTVKDHTSRIYLKTEVKNRMQLANLLRE